MKGAAGPWSNLYFLSTRGLKNLKANNMIHDDQVSGRFMAGAPKARMPPLQRQGRVTPNSQWRLWRCKTLQHTFPLHCVPELDSNQKYAA